MSQTATPEPAAATEAAPPTAAEVCARYDASEAVRDLLDDDAPPDAFLERLIQQGRYADAVAFLARWLPTAEAVWWGCLCAWEACRPDPSPEEDAALSVVVDWLGEPSEANRRRAEAIARPAKPAKPPSPAQALAMAVFLSGGSISLADLPHVDPPPDGAAASVAGAVERAALRAPVDSADERRRQFLLIGMQIAQGENHWEK